MKTLDKYLPVNFIFFVFGSQIICSAGALAILQSVEVMITFLDFRQAFTRSRSL